MRGSTAVARRFLVAVDRRGGDRQLEVSAPHEGCGTGVLARCLACRRRKLFDAFGRGTDAGCGDAAKSSRGKARVAAGVALGRVGSGGRSASSPEATDAA